MQHLVEVAWARGRFRLRFWWNHEPCSDWRASAMTVDLWCRERTSDTARACRFDRIDNVVTLSLIFWQIVPYQSGHAPQ